MRSLFRRVFALLLCLALVQAVLPARSAMACVNGGGRVLDLCPDAGHRAARRPAAPPRTCCHQAAVELYRRQAGKCVTDGNVHCATVSVAKASPPLHSAVAAIGVDLPVCPSVRWEPLECGPSPEGPKPEYPDAADPPPSRPRSPDLGRAPPLA